MHYHFDIPYTRRGDKDLLMDLFVPSGGGGPFPVVIHIPGGGWMVAPKSNAPEWLVDHGFAVAAIEYTISSVAIAPANVHDCKAAVRWLRAHATEHSLDAGRIGAWGASAGGHLAALLAVSAGAAPLEGAGGNPGFSSAIEAACDFCGPTDLSRMARPEVRQQYPPLYGVVSAYVGGPVEERLELARLVSPLTYVSPACPPMLIVHGLMDSIVPLDESILFDDALQHAGADATMRILDLADHGWDARLTNAAVLGFFQRALGGLPLSPGA